MEPTAPAFDLFWDDRFLDYDFGPGHPFQMSFRKLGVELVERTLADRPGAPLGIGQHPTIAVAPRETLERFHTARYLDEVEAASDSPRGRFLDTGDTPAFPDCSRASARIAEATVEACRIAVDGDHRSVVQPAGGLHHAHSDRASGFCVLNDVAVAIASLLDGPERVGRVAYVDIDAHHGDGVMYGFYEDGRLLDIDFHQDGRTIFPGTGRVDEVGRADGAGIKVNLPLPPGAGDDAFVPLFRRVVPPLIRDHRPELLILQHGVDGHAGDLLAQLQYTSRSYLTAVTTLRELAEELGHGRFVLLGGGGYLAENVSLGLAESILTLAGTSTLARDSLPSKWRSHFKESTGRLAPEDWSYCPPLHPSPWSADREERLVGGLTESLGRKFAPVS